MSRVAYAVRQPLGTNVTMDDRRIVFTEDDEFEEDNSQVRAIAGVVVRIGRPLNP